MKVYLAKLQEILPRVEVVESHLSSRFAQGVQSTGYHAIYVYHAVTSHFSQF